MGEEVEDAIWGVIHCAGVRPSGQSPVSVCVPL